MVMKVIVLLLVVLACVTCKMFSTGYVNRDGTMFNPKLPQSPNNTRISTGHYCIGLPGNPGIAAATLIITPNDPYYNPMKPAIALGNTAIVEEKCPFKNGVGVYIYTT